MNTTLSFLIEGFLSTLSRTSQTELLFNCTSRQRTTTLKVNRRMHLDAAEQHCAKNETQVKTPDKFVVPVLDTMMATSYYWTGSRRHNLTHFKREDGLLFEPEGITGTWRGFQSTVMMTVWKNGSIEAFNAMSDRRDCLCALDDMTTLKLFFRHSYFFIGLFVTFSIICIAICLLLYIRVGLK